MSIATLLDKSKTIQPDRRWLEDMIRKGKVGPFAIQEPVMISPELAELLLLRNPGNRPLKTWHIEEMARDISEGRWGLTGQTIAVSSCGLLNDGQNRCSAVVMAGVPAPVFMVFGVSRRSRQKTDIGRTRTVGDFLGMESVANSNNVAAAAQYIMKIERWGKITTGMDKKLSKPQITEFGLQIQEDLAFGLRACGKHGHGRIAPLSQLVTAHYMMSQKDPDAADEFMSDLIRGTGLEAGDPVFVARDKLMDPTKRLNPNERFKTLFSAWNNRRLGRKVRTLQHSMKRQETLPELK